MIELIRGDKPVAIIVSPPSGSSFAEGQEIPIRSLSIDREGIARVELVVDGEIIDTHQAITPTNQLQLTQDWLGKPGSHTVIVRSYDLRNNVSSPAAISIQISPATATPPRAHTPTITANNPSPSPTECVNNAAFVADITVPDGSLFTPNQSFNKIWRLRNNGTCAWGAGYQFVFISGDAMTTNTVSVVPPTAPGATADFLIAMNAPGDYGSHTGIWRLRSPSGVLFGTIATVKINVPSAASNPANPTRAVSGPCSGTPNILAFSVDHALITWGASTTLRWSEVTNADSVEIDQGIGGVGAGPGGGTLNISPTRSTIYTMTAYCGSKIATRQVTVLVPFAVTSVVGSVEPTSSSVCSQVFNFHFVISVNSPGTVDWRRERSDGNVTFGSYAFSDAGSFTADYTWQPGSSGTFWIQVRTTSPTDVTSNQAVFTLTCP